MVDVCFGVFCCVLAVFWLFFAVFWLCFGNKTHIKRENETETQFKTQVVDVCFEKGPQKNNISAPVFYE